MIICGICGSQKGTGPCSWCATYMPQARNTACGGAWPALTPGRPKGTPLAPVNVPTREDYGWLDNLTTAVSEAQEIYEQTYADWNEAHTRALIAQERINMHHMDHRALARGERHEYVTHQAEIAYAKGCWDAYERARERYFRLLAELGEAEQPSRALPSRRGFEDPSDPYRDTSRDDGSLAWAQRRAERDRQDRRREPSRGFTPE